MGNSEFGTLGCWTLDFRFWDLNFGFGGLDSGLWTLDSGPCWKLGLWALASAIKIEDFGFRFRVVDVGLWI